jgi:rSAM/selenodomain-associated transferase 1
MTFNLPALERLIVFTRYPEPGKVKTRMIPAIGALAAANLHRQMAEYTLLQGRKLRTEYSISIAVHFDGKERDREMLNWLGADLIYQPQSNGDLGERMAYSLAAAFRDGCDRVVIIGTDCPGLNADFMQQAFDLLHSHDLVIGPAIDGGYYTIGMRYFISELFTDISWGTAQVFHQTVEIAKKLDLSIAYLPPLADVDLPEDLPVWEEIQRSGENQLITFTVDS